MAVNIVQRQQHCRRVFLFFLDVRPLNDINSPLKSAGITNMALQRVCVIISTTQVEWKGHNSMWMPFLRFSTSVSHKSVQERRNMCPRTSRQYLQVQLPGSLLRH